MILFSSVAIRSFDTIAIRSLLRPIASNVSEWMSKPSWAAKRTARIIRSGSSENVTSGSQGVRISRRSKSPVPSNGSTSSPNVAAFREKAIALIVKSLRSWSSSIVPSSTIGLRESARYDSLRAPTNSTSHAPQRSMAVPKFLNTDTRLPVRRPIASATSIPLPATTTSMSVHGRCRNQSRT